jgi:hypothetical protein
MTLLLVAFLVIARTLGSIINHLAKVEYWITQELEFKKEQVEIRKALAAEEEEQEKKKEEFESKG